ncbi:type I polyketide synthase [Amycolatopsis benzoatilytica]|uniref:type I polyketide synthase n=1 Tax=Amycolatopsis benzoatilytica TaxID=346045 RepID=UPI0003811FDB|nr:type I polyketide synthase [Amycolatopsis benzoatilytica]
MLANAAVETTGDEPIAIVGISFRFAPDLDTPERFWNFLNQEQSAVRQVPPQRWEPYGSQSPEVGAILRRTTQLGCYLDDITGFDANFFGVTPREAEFIDPQQRLMLELSWMALEHAGIAPTGLRGTDAGVFFGVSAYDYGKRLLDDIPGLQAWALNGAGLFGIANRVSYTLDLQGPSLSIDTACAGSLTAIHTACQNLWRRETQLALAGGVNLMAGPSFAVALDAAGATSPRGQSRAFDADADGYGRGEGAGIVVLKRLSDAQHDGDRVLALIRGGGLFQDGRTNGMMMPNGDAQESLLRQVCERTGIDPLTVDYVEAHGTGTPTGDPLEANAIANVYGKNRPAGRPCRIGSVKPNIGHLEAGAGVAGLIKTVLALQNEQIPPSPHDKPTPAVDWANSGLELVAEPTPWKRGKRVRRAGVSSYGIGGTISHVILEEAPTAPKTKTKRKHDEATFEVRQRVFSFSARSEAGARALAGKLANWLETHPETPIDAVGATLARRRAHLTWRGAAVASSRDKLISELRAVAGSEPTSNTVLSRADADTNPVWVFSGAGAQWAGMGRQLLKTEPVFAYVIDMLEPIMQSEAGFSIRQAIADGDWSNIAITHPTTFAIQVGLAMLWRTRGVQPAAVIGHSVGEYAASVAAGAVDIRDSAKAVCRRSVLVRRTEGTGAMAMVPLPFDEAERRLHGRDDVVAAISASPTSTVISGGRDAVTAVAEEWTNEGLMVRRVDTEVPFHSDHMDQLLPELTDQLRDIASREPVVPFYSTSQDDPRGNVPLDGTYWVGNLRNPVHFLEAVQAAINDGHTKFLEISTHPIVAHSIRETLEAANVDATVHTSLRRDREQHQLLVNLAELHCSGGNLDWTRLYPNDAFVELPTMAWQRQQYWVETIRTGGARGGGHAPDSHTLIGGRTWVSGASLISMWETHLDYDSRPYPNEHPVHGVEIVPAAVLLSTFMTAGDNAALTDVELRIPVVVEVPRTLQVVLQEGTLRLASRTDGSDDEAWLTHTTAALDHTAQVSTQYLDEPAIKRVGSGEEWTWERFDEWFRARGVDGYGFPWKVESLHRNDRELLASMQCDGGSWAEVLDGALTITPLLLPDDELTRMPSNIRRFVVAGNPLSRLLVHAWTSEEAPDTVDVLIANEDGRVVAEITGLRFGVLDGAPGTMAGPRDLVHEITWEPFAIEQGTDLPEWAVVVGTDEVASALAKRLDDQGILCRQVPKADDIPEPGPGEYGLVVIAPGPDTGADPVDQAERATWSLIRATQRIPRTAGANVPRLWCLTRGVRAGRDRTALAHRSLWGAARIISGERPDLWGGLVDVDPDVTNPEERALALLLSTPAPGEDIYSATSDSYHVERMIPVEREPERPELECRPDGTYLVTGGLGAIGLQVARWLVGLGARRIVLAGRNGLPPRNEWDTVTDPTTRERIDAVRALEHLGATVRVVALDVADPNQVAEALTPEALGLPPIRGVVHAAGVVNDALAEHMDTAGLARTMRPKARGAMVLHEQFPPGTLDFFVLFSSSGQFARTSGVVTYAAANSFLDAVADYRRANGGRDVVSVAWMAWLGTGMASDIASSMAEANANGIDGFTPDEAFQAWQFLSRIDLPYFVVLRPVPVPDNVPRPAVLTELTTATGDGPTESTSILEEWAGLSEDELLAHVRDDLVNQVAEELKQPAADVDVRRPLPESGVDSVMAVSMRARLQRRYGLSLPPTILWDHPTIPALAEHVTELLKTSAAA